MIDILAQFVGKSKIRASYPLRRILFLLSTLILVACLITRRAAAKFFSLANRFTSSVKIIKDEHEIDGKSILGILTLAAVLGTKITLKVSGKDESAALKALVGFINIKFQ